MRSRSFCQGILLVGCLILFISFCLDAAEAKDYYSILGVSRQATIKEIKKAYRTLSKDFHPDRFPGDKEIEQKYILINEAHDVLKDEEKRRTYDIHGVEGLKQGQGYFFSSPSFLFPINHFFSFFPCLLVTFFLTVNVDVVKDLIHLLISLDLDANGNLEGFERVRAWTFPWK